MDKATESLPDDVEQLKQMLLSERSLLAEKDHTIGHWKQQYQQILEQFRLAQQKRFGSSSESSSAQAELFDEAEQAGEVVEQTSEPETIQYTRNKPRRKPLPRDLPRDTIEHDIAETDKICDCCGHDLHRMGFDSSEQLEFIPASIKVIEHVRHKYSCRHCEQQGIRVDIKIAPLPVSPIPRSIATPSLLSQIITSKYQYALPLYRQESLFKSYGIDLNRKTMASWMIRSSGILEGLYQRLKDLQLQQTVIHADETPLKVIHEDKNQCYMWVYCSGRDSPDTKATNAPLNIVLYDYQNSRRRQCARDYLQDFTGYLQVDGYPGYDNLPYTLVGCLAHARRKFIEAQQAQVKGKTGKADWAVSHIQKLYRIETAIKDKSPEQRYDIRQQQSRPLLEQLKAWLDKSSLQVPPKTAVGKAISYSLNQWHKLIRYIDDGRLSIDNNRAERAIKPFVIGRKNWMFSNTANGAQASAILYSLIETAKANGLTPFDYITRLLEQIPENPDSIDHLLPWNIDLHN